MPPKNPVSASPSPPSQSAPQRLESPEDLLAKFLILQNELTRLAFNADLDSFQRCLLQGANTLLGGDAAVLVLNDEANPGWWIFKSLDLDDRWALHLQPDDGKSAISDSVHSEKPVRLDGDQAALAFDPTCTSQDLLQSRSLLCAPLVASGENLGALMLLHREMGAFNDEQLPILASLAASSAFGIQTARRIQDFRLSSAGSIAENWDAFESRSFLRAIFEHLPASLYIIDQDYHLLAANKSRLERSGRASDDLLGLPCFQALFGLDAPCLECRVHETLSEGRTTTRTERRREAGLQVLEWEISSFPILDGQGSPSQSILLETDISEKRHLEAVLIQSEKLAAVGQLAAGVAHEINNPLTAIIANAQILRREISPDSDLQESVDLISRAGARAAQVVRNLLDFARKEEYRLGRTDLNQTIERALELVQHELLAHGITIHLQLTPDLPPLLASADHLQSVWLNLLLNAIDSLDKSPQTISISSGKSGSEMQVSVRDNGKGISPEHLPLIFEPFYTTKAPGRGTGLGLSVSRRIIQQHGGSIWVESQPGEGSAFIVTLPTV